MINYSVNQSLGAMQLDQQAIATFMALTRNQLKESDSYVGRGYQAFYVAKNRPTVSQRLSNFFDRPYYISAPNLNIILSKRQENLLQAALLKSSRLVAKGRYVER